MAANSDPNTTVTVSNDDVTVEKTFEEDEFPVPAIKFVIRSTADDPVDLRLTDRIPESFPMERIGFHPDYESDRWTAYRDNRVEYERTVDPDEEVLTVYGVRLDSPEEATAFLVEPTIERQSAARPEPTDILGRETNQVVREALAGEDDAIGDLSGDAVADSETASPEEEAAEADQTPGEHHSESDPDAPDDDAIEAAIAEAESDDAEATEDPDPEATEDLDDGVESSTPLDLDDPTETSTTDGDADETGQDEPATPESEATTEEVEESTDDGSDADAGETEPTEEVRTAATAAVAGGSVASALAAEIRDGDVPEADLQLLREELDFGTPTSLESRVDRLEGTVAELDAYTDALSEFLDENGTGRQLLDDLTDGIESLEATVDELETAVSTGEGERAELAEELEGVEEDVAGVREELRDDLEDVEDRLQDQSTAVDDLSADVDAIVTDVERLEEDLEEVSAAIEEVDADLANDVEDVRDRIDSLEEELEDLRSFRDRLSDVLGS